MEDGGTKRKEDERWGFLRFLRPSLASLLRRRSAAFLEEDEEPEEDVFMFMDLERLGMLFHGMVGMEGMLARKATAATEPNFCRETKYL